jgi:hypothetical protein
MYVLIYEIKTYGVTSDEIRLLALFINQKSIDFSLETWLPTSYVIHIITYDFKRNWAEYELQSWLTPT